MENKKVVVVGAGAAGLMAASTAAAYGAGVTLIEKNKRVGRKIMITGKGRCNVCNNCDVETFIRNVPVNGKFLYSAINKLTPEDTIAFLRGSDFRLKPSVATVFSLSPTRLLMLSIPYITMRKAAAAKSLRTPPRSFCSKTARLWALNAKITPTLPTA